MAIKVLLADDHPMTRAGLAAWLRDSKRFSLVGEAQDGIEAWNMVRELKPDVLLLDIDMPGASGVEVARRLKYAGLKSNVLMLTSYKAQQYVLASLRAGAKGFILKTAPLEDLERAIELTSQGKPYIDAKVSHLAVHQDLAPEELSPREREVLLLTAKGLSAKITASELMISERTVEAHLASIYGKLGARNKTEAILLAIKNGVILVEELAVEGEEVH